MPKKNKNNSKGLWLLAMLAFMALLFFLMSGKRGFIRQYKIRRHRARLKQEIETLQKLKDTLKVEKKSLDQPETIEKIAREKYGMAKENETVYRVVPREE